VDPEVDCTIHELECIGDWNGLWTKQCTGVNRELQCTGVDHEIE